MHDRSDTPRCGCADQSAPASPPIGPVMPPCRPVRLGSAAPEWVEVTIARHASSSEVLLRASEATPELISQLQSERPDLPSLETPKGRGAIDVRLEQADGTHVKGGVLLLEGPGGPVAVPLDPTTRRFRIGSLATGKYMVRGAESEFGRASASIEVRDQDVTRQALRLDGVPANGRVDLEFAVRGASSESVQVRITDLRTGNELRSEQVRLIHGKAHIKDVAAGRLHIDITDVTGAASCYDQDAGDREILKHLPVHTVTIDPHRIVQPGPPDPAAHPLFSIPDRYASLTKVLPELGVRTVRDLAHLEGEDLMHRFRASPLANDLSIPNPVFGGAILEARRFLGLAKIAGTQVLDFTLGEGQGLRRSFLPSEAGTAVLSFSMPEAGVIEVGITRGSAVERTTIRGNGVVHIPVSAADLASAALVEVSVLNVAESTPVRFVSEFPASHLVPGSLLAQPTVHDNIETVYRAWAGANPGFDPTLVATSLDPDNVRGWLDRARTYFSIAGVCSLNDLGTLRIQPARVLHPGVYVAPRVAPGKLAQAVALKHYVATDLINKSAVYYKPNDTLHDTLIVLADSWDITKAPPTIIGNDVREVVVIARTIRFDSNSKITWESAALPGPLTYFPDKPPRAPDGAVTGEAGHPGERGDQDPHPARNGGANADTAAPIVTLYILDTSGGLPPIDFAGQQGGAGGLGQHGGDGGNGAKGEDADSHFFSGCCRSVGHGGRGGDGGAAGRGGQGGRGGAGGRLTLLTSEPSIAALASNPPNVDINPGRGGDGGFPGAPGVHGHGGPAGSADCELWCPSHPEYHGDEGVDGGGGLMGRTGDIGPPVLSDALQIYPLTEAQWNAEFNQPHILHIDPTDAEPGEEVTIRGSNFQPATDKVLFDGAVQPDLNGVTSSESAHFTVPLAAEGGTHPVKVATPGTTRISNRAMLRVIPKLDAIASGTRWVENQVVILTGLAFAPGCTVFVEDWSTPAHSRFGIPVLSSTRTQITLQVPGPPLANMRGVRRVFVRNPDGGTSRGEIVVRLSDTIVVNVAAFRVVGTSAGVGTPRSATDIANLFNEGGVNTVNAPWGVARIAFRLVQPVGTITIDDLRANLWPKSTRAEEVKLCTDNGGIPGAINVCFLRDVEEGTAHAWFGGGPVLCGEEPDHNLNAVDFAQVMAHELGHALCLPHVCPNSREAAGDTTLARTCQDADATWLMYPYYDASDSTALMNVEVTQARTSATCVEQGKADRFPVGGFACTTTDDTRN